MTVKTAEQLNELAQEGWIPYWHEGVRRWYLRRRQERKIIATCLEPYAEDLAAHAPTERNKITPEIEAEVVQRRMEEQRVDAIAAEMNLPHRTVVDIIGRHPDGRLEVDNPTNPPSKPDWGPPEFDLPREVEPYVQRLGLKVVAEPEKKIMPGYRNGEAYAIPIEDVETEQRLTIVYPLPTYRAEGYETVTVTNKEGKKVKVMALKGDEEHQSENPLAPWMWSLLAVGVAVGVGVGATLLDKFLGPMLGWNPKGRWWWEPSRWLT